MAKNEPNGPDDVKTTPVNEASAEKQTAPATTPPEIAGDTPAPEMTAEEVATLAHEGEAALQEMGEAEIEPPAPSDIGGEHIPVPGDVVVPFDKINELVSEKQKAAREAKQTTAPEKQETEQKKPSQKQVGQQDKAAPQEAKDSEKEDTRQEWEKPLSEVEAKKERKPRAEKQKPATEKKTPEKEPELTPAQKGGQTRKARKAEVIDFIEGKRTSPLPDGKPISDAKKKAPVKEEVPTPEPEKPPEPKEAPRKGEPEQIVYINLSELHAFKNHPFAVRDDEEMRAMVESVKDKGVTQPAIVRPLEDGGYEIVSGHRRQKASELAGFFEMPCIVRNLTDEEAITQMVEDNTNQRENILPSERAKALKMQLEAIKRQGARADLSTSGQDAPKSENGQRSNQIVAERNKMTVKQVQRYIKLNDLVPDLMKMVDEKKIAFTPAVEMAYIKPKNQRYIAVAIEGQQSAPSLSQAQRMRELDGKGILNADVIDGIMLEEKKEADKVIISSQELSQYFGKDKTPREMKDTIIKLLDEWKGQQKDITKPEKQAEQEK
ncbi:chromosome-partitioning protein Spo0J [Oxobacter pfennigii]|uniref:Chromosome-partitioning protein Spo0J n=2 Tax=Oxobacter pfennigii TaxID=36849 RepID=A0A0P8W694_9CLOT|nr:ParB/RepB/Spo0J family partition protein [Oxobacter pfennigii]KPU43236.1 chromosome-partitioning protein Spo0J [Oxobacter pfennigii]